MLIASSTSPCVEPGISSICNGFPSILWLCFGDVPIMGPLKSPSNRRPNPLVSFKKKKKKRKRTHKRNRVFIPAVQASLAGVATSSYVYLGVSTGKARWLQFRYGMSGYRLADAEGMMVPSRQPPFHTRHSTPSFFPYQAWSPSLDVKCFHLGSYCWPGQSISCFMPSFGYSADSQMTCTLVHLLNWLLI